MSIGAERPTSPHRVTQEGVLGGQHVCFPNDRTVFFLTSAGQGVLMVDTDGDCEPDATDPDDDNDGVPDHTDPDNKGVCPAGTAPAFFVDPSKSMCLPDTDGDGTADIDDPDDDGDGMPDAQDPDTCPAGTAPAFFVDPSKSMCLPDTDGDGTADIDDPDDDGDGMPDAQDPDTPVRTSLVCPRASRRPRHPCHHTIPPTDPDPPFPQATCPKKSAVGFCPAGYVLKPWEAMDQDEQLKSINGIPACVRDTDGDCLADDVDPDIDGDGMPNTTDPDDDGDGILDHQVGEFPRLLSWGGGGGRGGAGLGRGSDAASCSGLGVLA